MTTQDLYNQYPIPKNLQTHMLRAAALAQIIVENWTGPNIDKDSIIKACLFHDAGKLVKFNFSNAKMLDPDDHDLAYWQKKQQEMFAKYGREEHPATRGVCVDMGLPAKVIALFEKMEWEDIEKHLAKNDLEACILVYCDTRIGPFGILPIRERIDDLASRRPKEDFSRFYKSTEILEKTLQQHTAIDLNAVQNNDLNQRFENLLLLN